MEEPVLKIPTHDRTLESVEQLKKKPFTKRLMDNLITPVCLLATAGCLSLGLFNMYKGDSAKQQFYMRGRVACQGAALVTMLIGMNNLRSKKRNE